MSDYGPGDYMDETSGSSEDEEEKFSGTRKKARKSAKRRSKYLKTIKAQSMAPIPLASFKRLLQDIIKAHTQEKIQTTTDFVSELKHFIEQYIIGLFRNGLLVRDRCKRVSLQAQDLGLVDALTYPFQTRGLAETDSVKRKRVDVLMQVSVKHKNLSAALLLRLGKYAGVNRFADSEKVVGAVRRYIIRKLDDILMVVHDILAQKGGGSRMTSEHLQEALRILR